MEICSTYGDTLAFSWKKQILFSRVCAFLYSGCDISSRVIIQVIPMLSMESLTESVLKQIQKVYFPERDCLRIAPYWAPQQVSTARSLWSCGNKATKGSRQISRLTSEYAMAPETVVTLKDFASWKEHERIYFSFLLSFFFFLYAWIRPSCKRKKNEKKW